MVVAVALWYYGGKWIVKKADGQIEEVTQDAANALIQAGTPVVDAITEGLSEAVSELGDVTLGLIKGAGIALVEGVGDTYDYVSDKLAPHRVDAVAITWSLIIYSLTAYTIMNRVRNS